MAGRDAAAGARRTWRRTARWVPWEVGLLTVVGAAIRIHGLGEESLWNDEFASMEDALALGPEVLVEQLRVARPLYYLLLRPWIEILGTSPAAMRSLSVVFGVAAIPAVYLLGRELYGHRTGLLAATLLTFSRLHVRWSQEVRMYALLALLAAVSMLLHVRYLDDGGRRDRWLYIAATVALLYTHLYGVFVVAAQVVHGAARLHRPAPEGAAPTRRGWTATVAAVAVLSLPAAVAVAATALEVAAGDRTVVAWLEAPHPIELLWMPVHQVYLAESPALLVAAAGVVVALAWLAVTDDGAGPRDLLVVGWLAAAVAVPFAVSVLVTPMIALRYTIAAVPAVAVLVGRGLDRALDRIDAAFVRRLMVVGLVVAMVPPLASYHQEPQHAQWRDAVDYVEAEAGSGDVVLVTPGHTARNYRYYATRDDLAVLPLNATADRDAVRERLRDADAAWVVASRNLAVERMQRLHEVLNGTTVRTSAGGEGQRLVASPAARSFNGVGVARYDVRAGGTPVG